MVKLGHMTTANNVRDIVPQWEVQDRIARARRYAGLDQAELARIAGVSRKSVSNWEIGKTEPRRAALIAISFATGVSLEWLETGNTPDGNNPDGGSAVRHQGIEPWTHWLRSSAA